MPKSNRLDALSNSERSRQDSVPNSERSRQVPQAQGVGVHTKLSMVLEAITKHSESRNAYQTHLKMRPVVRLLLVPVLFVAISIRTATCSHDSIVPGAFLFESFDSPDWTSRWEHSADDKYQGRFETAKIDSSNSVLKVGWIIGQGGTLQDLDKVSNLEFTDCIQIPKGHKFYGLTALLSKPLDPSEGLVVQYETHYPESYGEFKPSVQTLCSNLIKWKRDGLRIFIVLNVRTECGGSSHPLVVYDTH